MYLMSANESSFELSTCLQSFERLTKFLIRMVWDSDSMPLKMPSAASPEVSLSST